MPSFRITMTIGSLRPGIAPDSVLPAAAAATAELTTVEASDLAVVAGSARATVRYTADDAASAARIGAHTLEGIRACASVVTWQVTERVAGRWLPVR